MGTSNLDQLIVSLSDSDLDSRKLSHIRDYKCNSSSSQTPNAITNDSQEQIVNLVSGALKIHVRSSVGEFKVSNGEDDPKTPRSMEHRIPVMATCPPAPRKARWVPVTGKRKAPFFPVVGVPADFIVYMDAMLALNEAVYVPDIVVGDFGTGEHAKKLKLLPPPASDT